MSKPILPPSVSNLPAVRILAARLPRPIVVSVLGLAQMVTRFQGDEGQTVPA